ncbi:MAG: RluA family pseudouridine synthase [Anaerolineaceae bacterium]|nr:MAG: RluA family pseudouridine synthase [Anaerolineaceae bacterium]
MKEQRLRFKTSSPGGRLDVTLVTHAPDFSRSRLQQLIRSGFVKVDDEVIIKPGFRLDGGETVEVIIPPPIPSKLQAESIPLDIVFENEDIMLINKPAGMVVHPSAGHASGTLVHAALAHAPDIMGVGGEKRPGVVHRLDKDTSGLILLAKNDTAQNELQAQFKKREVGKTYLALVDGGPPTPAGRIEAPIGRDPGHRKKMKVLSPGKGREAISIFHVLESFPRHTLLEVNPKTGRTHQIRVHLAFLGCPVVGDRDYGQRKPTLPVERMFLHAAALTFTLPGDDQARSFEAPLPSDLKMVLDQLRKT